MGTKEQRREWGKAHQHPCIDCGQPCSYNAVRCRHCANIIAAHQPWKKRPKEPPHFCRDCGKPISARGRRCKSCASKYKWKTRPETRLKTFGKMEKHPNWKGGKIKDKQGYIRIYKPQHPRASKTGYVAEHLLVWEQTNNKSLPKGWIIHHLNGTKHDNRPSNLMGLPNKKHYLVLQAKAKRIQELEALLNNQHQLL